MNIQIFKKFGHFGKADNACAGSGFINESILGKCLHDAADMGFFVENSDRVSRFFGVECRRKAGDAGSDNCNLFHSAAKVEKMARGDRKQKF